MLPQSLAQRSYKGGPRIAAIHCQEFKVFRCCTRLRLHMHRPLKRQMIVWMHAAKSGDRWVDGLKIHKAKRVFEGFKFALQVCTEPRLARLHGVAGTPLNLAQLKISRYVVDRLDTHFLKLLRCAGMEAWQVADVVVWLWLIAMMKELARNRIGAMRPRGEIGSLRHSENT